MLSLNFEPIGASINASQEFVCVGGALNIMHMRSSKTICKLQLYIMKNEI
jgi:hypothetical protein